MFPHRTNSASLSILRTAISVGASLIVMLLMPSPSAASADPETTLGLGPCHLELIPEWAQCATFAVPIDHSKPLGPSLQLEIAVLPATSQPPQPDPIFILAGGPGQSAIRIAAQIKGALKVANRHRDIVLVDQRGTGASTPLDCQFDFDALAFDSEAKARAVGECLRSSPIELRHFSTLNHVRDLELVRAAMNVDHINLYGGSYGTRVAQVYIREFPDSLGTVVMDGVTSMQMRVGLEMGSDAQRALDAVLERCAGDTNCSRAFPEPARQLEELLLDLAENPRTVSAIEPATGAASPMSIDHRIFALGLRSLLYSPSTQRAIPFLIDRAADDDWTGFIGLTSAFNQGLLDFMNPALLLAVLCQEDLANLTPEDIPQHERESFVGSAQIDEFLGFCSAFDQPSETISWQPAVSAEVPVLLLSGALDPATPPYRAAEAATTLDDSRHLVVSVGGHGVGGMGCLPDLLGQVFESQDPQALDASCLDELRFPSFFVNNLGPSS